MTDPEITGAVRELLDAVNELVEAVRGVTAVLPKLSDAVLEVHQRTIENSERIRKLEALRMLELSEAKEA